jgi:hypothetical protein
VLSPGLAPGGFLEVKQRKKCGGGVEARAQHDKERRWDGVRPAGRACGAGWAAAAPASGQGKAHGVGGGVGSVG